MTRRLLAATFAALLLPLMVLLAPPAQAAAGDTAAGTGTVRAFNGDFCNGGNYQFQIQASGSGSGNAATGAWTMSCADDMGVAASGTVECLRITEFGATLTSANVGGAVTASTNPRYPASSSVGFWLLDRAGGTDSFGSMPLPNPTDCNSFAPSTAYALTSGEITLNLFAAGDADGDGVKNGADNCTTVANAGQADADGDGRGDACDSTPTGDNDSDGVDNGTDNCPSTANAGQADADGDGTGDVCDDNDNDGPAGDLDGDGTPNDTDTDDTDGPDGDSDSDGVNNGTDNCPSTANAGQADADGDGTGDLCDPTPDGATEDSDGDGVADDSDNCPTVANAGQADNDGDGRGDRCEANHARSITLQDTHISTQRATNTQLAGTLAVADTASKCVQGRKVLLARYNPRTEDWSRVATAFTDTEGNYSTRIDDRPGNYRARVKRHSVTYDGFTSTCSPASTTARHQH